MSSSSSARWQSTVEGIVAMSWLEDPVRITVSKRRLFLILIGAVALWILATVIFGGGREKSGYGSYLRFASDNEYDECGTVPLPERIEDLRRILLSVRAEVAESSARLQETNKQYEQMSMQIPLKKNELALVQSEIENAKSELRDLMDRRNVRVSLPSRPLLPLMTRIHSIKDHDGRTVEDVVDYSRCSISTPLRIYLYPSARKSSFYETVAASPYIDKSPTSACLFLVVTDNVTENFESLPYWSERGANHVIVNTGDRPISINASDAVVVQSRFEMGTLRRGLDYLLPLTSARRTSDWQQLPQLLPYSRKFLLTLVVMERWPTFEKDTVAMEKSMREAEDTMRILECGGEKKREKECEEEGMRDALSHSHFTIITSSSSLLQQLMTALRAGSIPVLMSRDTVLPLEDTIDWSRAVLRFAAARLPEAHFLLRDVPMADALEMRRRGRRLLEEYLDSEQALWSSLAASLSERLSLPPRSLPPAAAVPLFEGNSFTAPIQTPVNQPVYADDEYLGPQEKPFDSPQYLYNVTSLSLYSYARWNEAFSVGGSPEFLINAAEMPNGAEFQEDTAAGFRPIEPGSGKEFALALGGNRQREQFTVVMLTYNRDAVLAASLERLHKCPYLNKVIVIWNNIEREPQGAWPRLHVPVEFIRAERNSLNNRFMPWDRITTEAVLSLDDDIDLKQHEIVFAFRVWRENRRKLVGFPARQHSRFGSDLFYNSNHTCQLSMILTGAAFIHKSYLYAYTYQMPAVIREHVDKVTNCEDIAMNFLIAHLTREPPLKTTSKWTLKCPTCTESLWSDGDHFNERHDCIRLLIRIYGYNPLRYSQYRADSILFKTRIPADMQKCFRYV